MKKKFLLFCLMACFIIPMSFLFGGCKKSSPEIEFQVEDGFIQYYDGEVWRDLIAVEELKGENGIGIKGREVQFQKTSTHIQWKYEGESTWNNLIALSEIKGKDATDGEDGREVEFRKTEYSILWRYVDNNQGPEDNWNHLCSINEITGNDGKDGATWYNGNVEPTVDYPYNAKVGDYYLHTSTSDVYTLVNRGSLEWRKIANLNANVEKVVVKFDANLPEYMYEFDEYIATNKKLQDTTIYKGSWLELENFQNKKLSDYFLGWYIGEGVDETKITSYTSINADCTLTAKWDYDKIHETYTSYGVRFGYWTSNSIHVSLNSNCGDVVHIAKTHSGKTITMVDYLADAINTKEVILPCTAKATYGGRLFLDEIPNNSTLEKVSWMECDDVEDHDVVTKIDSYAFANCSALKEIKIPNNIKEIGSYAFANCTSLEDFDLKQVVTIGNNAFYNCSGLKNLKIWYVESIGEYAFYNCSSLATSGYGGAFDFYIVNSVKTIGNNAFEGCISLTTIYIDSTDIANLTNNDSYLFSYANTINIKKSITTEATAYLDDSQGHFLRSVTGNLDSHDILNRVDN